MHYERLEDWGNALRSSYLRVAGSTFLRDVLSGWDLSTPMGVKHAADDAIMRLNRGDVPVEDASDIWQVSQCLKKFRYGGQIDESEMVRAWLERNELCAQQTLPTSVEWEMRRLLAPLSSAWDIEESCGRFGNGAVAEGANAIARWNALYREASFDPYDPARISAWSRNDLPSCARLELVPKDMFKRRVITVEPLSQAFYQQYVRDRLLRAAAAVMPRSSAIPQQVYGGGPEVQQERCRIAASHGGLATIDLSAASDSISLDTVSRVFPVEITAALERARSEYVSVNGTTYRVHMYAGMGNATTFIVESLYFWALFTALSRLTGCKVPVSVFGDDTILARRVALNPWVRGVLASAGITVNEEKSGLSDGPGFREACGAVFYKNVAMPLLRIRGYRSENPLELEALCSLINGMVVDDSWCLQVLGCSLRGCVHRGLNVPYTRVLLDGGRYLYRSNAIAETRKRWNTALQRLEYRVTTAHATLDSVNCGRDLTQAEADAVFRGQMHPSCYGGRIRFEVKGRREAPPKLRTEWRGEARQPYPPQLLKTLNRVIPGCI